MKKILSTLFTLAFLVGSYASASAVDPSVSMKYDGADVALSVSKSQNEEGAAVWSFITPDGKVAVDVTVLRDDAYPDFTRFMTRVRNISTEEPTGVVTIKPSQRVI